VKIISKKIKKGESERRRKDGKKISAQRNKMETWGRSGFSGVFKQE
jgi:hypothetical protein